MTATGLSDLHATPFAPACPGVEINATALANFLTGDFLTEARRGVIWGWALLGALLVGGFVGFTRPLVSVGLTGGMGLGLFLLSGYFFHVRGLWLDFTTPGVAIGLAYVLANVHAFWFAERERLRAAAEARALKQLAEMKSDYISFVSHELRTPLTSIKGFTGTLQRDTHGVFDGATRQEFYGIIAGECDHLLRLINEHLDIARLEAGRQLPVEMQKVDLQEVVTKAVTTQRYDSRGGHILTLDLPPDLPPVWADPDRLDQILANLLSNAMKYSPNGGTITVAARMEGGKVVVSVRDEGIGIPADELPYLFEQYHRVQTAQTRQIRGTGLGLYLTKALVEAQGGRIWVESEVGIGSTFSFALATEGRR